MAITEADLSALLGKHIREICARGYAADTDNHCAHFVSHVMGYSFQTTCGTMMHGEGATGCIRVQQIFPRCPRVGAWATLPADLTTGLVFITNAGNVNLANKTMENVPRKHIGIFYGPERRIFHYSNSRHRVVSQSPAEFSGHYAAPDNAMFWGEAP
jgi:hypothetical protein